MRRPRIVTAPPQMLLSETLMGGSGHKQREMQRRTHGAVWRAKKRSHIVDPDGFHDRYRIRNPERDCEFCRPEPEFEEPSNGEGEHEVSDAQPDEGTGPEAPAAG